MTVVANKPFSKLSLPAQQQSSVAQATPKAASEIPQDQPYASTIYDLIAQELGRVGAKASNASLLGGVIARIVRDDALFRRLAIQAVRKQCLRRIKKIRRRVRDDEVKP
jgi:hypothetical protein